MWRSQTGALTSITAGSGRYIGVRLPCQKRMDRELLLELGTEELPASWLPALTRQIRDGLAGALRVASAGRRCARRKLQHAPPPDRPHRENCRAADRSRRAADRPAGGGGVRCGWHADSGGGRLRAQEQHRRRATRARGHAERHIPRISQASARQGGGRCAARRAGHNAAIVQLSQGHALGRLSRGRERRPAVRAPDSLDSLPLRRARRAVHDSTHGTGRVGRGTGSCVGRRDLRPPLPDDQRQGRARSEGAHL